MVAGGVTGVGWTLDVTALDLPHWYWERCPGPGHHQHSALWCWAHAYCSPPPLCQWVVLWSALSGGTECSGPGPLAIMMIPSPAPHTTPHTIQSNVPLKMYFSTSRRNESVPLGWSILPHNEFGHNQVLVLVLVLVRALVCGEFIKSFCASRNGGGGLFANTFSRRYKKQQGVNSTHSAFSQHWRQSVGCLWCNAVSMNSIDCGQHGWRSVEAGTQTCDNLRRKHNWQTFWALSWWIVLFTLVSFVHPSLYSWLLCQFVTSNDGFVSR